MRVVYLGVSLTLILMLVSSSSAEVVADTSDAFSFPNQTDISSKDIARHGSAFSYRILHTQGVMPISWSFPGISNKLKGSLTVYNLKGKVIKKFSVLKSSGTAEWNFKDSRVASGVYYAVVNYGKYSKKMKMMLYK